MEMVKFVKKSYHILPKYIQTLKTSEYSKRRIGIRKKVLLFFLKDFLQLNKGKDTYQPLDANYLESFIFSKASTKYPPLARLHPQVLLQILTDFIQFTTLKKILRRKTGKSLLNIFRKDQVKEYEKFQITEEPYPQEHQIMQYLENTEDLIDEFLFTDYDNGLSEKHIKLAFDILSYFIGYMYVYTNQTVHDWHPDALEFICLEVFPAEIPEGKQFFQALVPVLSSFLTFLKQTSHLSGTKVNKLKLKLYSLSKVIISTAMDQKKWGFKRSKVVPRITIFQELRSAPTGELIQLLLKQGIKFTKEMFLEDLQQFFMVEDLVDYWYEKYGLEENNGMHDFIWVATAELWKRLAPDVINFEQLDNMMQKGYELSDKQERFKACDLWLEIWEHFRSLFDPSFTSIDQTTRTFNGTQIIFNWTQDLMMELYNAGLRDEKYFQKRLIIAQEILRLFPESPDLYIHNMMRVVAESHYRLGQFQQGERVFKDLIKKFPNNEWSYISYGDQFGDFKNDRYNYSKARSIYQQALQICTNNRARADVKERIEMLEKEKKGLNFRKELLTEYASFLSEKDWKEKTITRKMKNARSFLNHVIFTFYLENMEDFEIDIGLTDVLEFLGTYSILHNHIDTKTELIELCSDLKTFLLDFDIFYGSNKSEQELRKICNEKDFYLQRYKRYNDLKRADISPREKRDSMSAWLDNSIQSYRLYQLRKKPRKADKEKEKVSLSPEKRKLFKKINEFSRNK